MLWALFLVVGPSYDMMAWVLSLIVSTTTDMGTELLLVETPDVLNAFLLYVAGNALHTLVGTFNPTSRFLRVATSLWIILAVRSFFIA